VGRPKVAATARAIRQLDPDVDVDTIDDRYRAKQQLGEAIFACVDSIEARRAIWRSAGHRAEFWGDGRMLGETIRILVAANETSRLHYPTTLFAASEAEQGRCTARSTIYTATIAAGLMVPQFVRWLRRQPIDADTTLNLLAGEMLVGFG